MIDHGSHPVAFPEILWDTEEKQGNRWDEMKQERKRLLSKVAYLYYVEDLSQAQISKKLGIYRTTVSRMIAQARKEGIVKIEITDFDSELFALEEYVKEKYGLLHLEIVETGEEETDSLTELASRAATLIRNSAKEGDTIGISWGATLSQVVAQIDPRYFQNIRVCPLAGGPSHINSKYHVNTLVYELARKFQGKSSFINATVLQETPALARGIIKSKYFSDTLAFWQHLDVAIVGVGGTLSQESSQWRDLLTTEDIKTLAEEKAIGESCCRFVNAAGDLVHEKLQERIIAIPFELLRRVPTTIGVAYGEAKSQAILALIKQGYLNSLVTDRPTILAMLANDGDTQFFPS